MFTNMLNNTYKTHVNLLICVIFVVNFNQKKTKAMRKVLFKKWIPRIDKKLDFGTKPLEGTNCWEKEFKTEGLFHQWANAFEESSEGFGNYTVALVEIKDGSIVEVLPSNIKFIN